VQATDDVPYLWLQLRSPSIVLGTVLASALVSACGAARALQDDGDDTAGADEGDPAFDPQVCGDWIVDDGPADPSPSDPSCVNCIHFENVTEAAGLEHRQYAAASGPDDATCMFDGDDLPNTDCQPQWFSGGLAVGDYDADGWPDLFFTRLGAPDRLYRNRGDGTFEDVTTEAGLGDCTFTNGAAFGDIDDDGDLDLVVTALGGPAHHLYVNDGAGHFADEAAARGVALDMGGPHGGQSVTMGDYDLDGDLDLHLNEWLRPRNAPASPTGPLGSRLLRNDGNGHFDDVTAQAGVQLDGRSTDGGVYGFASTFVDLDADGHPELVVAADFRTSALFWNRGDGTFEEGSEAAGVNTESNAMGSTFGDFDDDGDLDWFVTSIAQMASCAGPTCGWIGTGNRLYRNDGGRTFAEISEAADVRDAGWGWGAAWGDLDGDGDLDLAATNGWPGPDLQGGRLFVATPMRLWMNVAGRLEDEAAARGADDPGQGRGLALIDYDLDGDLDVLVARHGQSPQLLRNAGRPESSGGVHGHWLSVDVRADAGSAPASPGAVVRVWPDDSSIPLVRHVGVGAHFLAEVIGPVHFGLGEDASVARLEVEWPASGRKLVRLGVSANQRLVVTESEGS